MNGGSNTTEFRFAMLLLLASVSSTLADTTDVKGKLAAEKVSIEVLEAKHLAEDKARLEVLEAKYEEKFKKNAPRFEEDTTWDSIFDRTMSLKYALAINYPYPTREEKNAEDEKIKIEYKKRFGVPISDFELSIMRVDYKTSSGYNAPYGGSTNFSADRTATGAILKYNQASGRGTILTVGQGRGWLDYNLNMNEWLDFIRILYKCRINEWENSYPKNFNTLADMIAGPSPSWHFKVYSLDKIIFTSNGYGLKHEHPPNWKAFKKAINDMEAKIKKTGTKADTSGGKHGQD